MAHAGWFKDGSAQGQATKGTVIHWAHNWIVGAFTLRLPRWPLVRWVLPAVFALYRQPSDCDKVHPFRTRQVLPGQMIQRVTEALLNVQSQASPDGAYSARPFLMQLPKRVNLVSRIRRDAATCALKQGRQVQRLVLGTTCLWHHVCKDKPIRMVIVRDRSGKQEDDFFFCTDATAPDEQIVQPYYDRWGVEDSIPESEQHMGFESTRGWSSKTVNRQAPLTMVLVTLVKAWYSKYAPGEPLLLPESTPWYPGKKHPSFADMLSTLRRMLWRHRISPNSTLSARAQQMWNAISYALSAVA